MLTQAFIRIFRYKKQIKVMETIDQFIRRLQAISEDKRKLPLVIACPNGLLVSPKIKMVMKDDLPFNEVEKMIITY